MTNKHLYIYLILSSVMLLYLSHPPAPWNLVYACASIVYIVRGLTGLLKDIHYEDILKGNMEKYEISYDQLPTDRLFVGKGFMWTPEHTRGVTKLITDAKLLENGEVLGGLSLIHGIGVHSEKEISVPLADLVGHTVVIGTTRVGKTRGYEIFICQAIKRNEPVVVLDPKGDVDLLNRVVEACRQFGRKDSFVFFALPYPKFSACYNPLKNFTIPNEIPDRVAMLLPSEGSSESFRSFAWQVISVVTNALLYLKKRPNIRLLSEYSLAKTEELCKECITEAIYRTGSMHRDTIEQLNDDESAEIGDYIRAYKSIPGIQNSAIDDLILLVKHPREHFQKMTASLTPLLSKLATGEIGLLLSGNDGTTVKTEIDWERVVKNNKVVYMLFGSLLMRDTAKAIMRMTMQDITSFIGSRYAYLFDKKPFNVVIDEFTEVVDSSFINLLNKAGGAGVRIMLASQSVADLESELRSSARAQQIFDNLNTKLWLRISDLNTAGVFADAAGTTVIPRQSTGYSISPDLSENADIVYKSSYSQSTSESVSPLIDPSWLLKLPKGQGFLLSGGRVYKVRIPLLKQCKVDYYREIGIS